MKTARLILKIVALSLAIAAAICALVAYWDKLIETTACATNRIREKAAMKAEYDDYEE